ncbi:unnamed protein product, partial [Iphiclides podalirius]
MMDDLEDEGRLGGPDSAEKDEVVKDLRALNAENWEEIAQDRREGALAPTRISEVYSEAKHFAFYFNNT